jgi:DNA helicase-2/ATP-dependent DNA helicase PcrA
VPQKDKLGNILSQLNPTQQEAVTYSKGPLLILAGPGSGKTRTLTYRAAYLIQEKEVKADNILLLTFTNKAALEMKNRLKKILQQEKTPFAGTFHSFCAQILRINGKYLKIPPNYLIYDKSDQLETIKMVLKRLDLSVSQFKPSSVATTISQAKNELISALEYPQYAQGHWQETVARIYLKYQQFLKEYQALDFDDLLLETVRLFRKEKEVLEKYQNKYHWFLIDEYQDTNQAQYILTKLLTKKWRNLNAVGDASQAIYGWRGANYRNLLNLKDDFPDLKVINLERNYRSTETILEAANSVIKQNTTHPVLNLWTEKKGGQKISLFQAKNEHQEADFIIEKIKNYLLEKKSLPPQGFAVLYRTNAQSRIIEESFLHHGIPYILVGGVRFYERKEIKDCLAYLRLIANSQDKLSLKRAEKIGKRRLKKFFDFSEKKKKPKKELTTIQWLDGILESTKYLDQFNEDNPQELSRIENVKELRSVAEEFPNLHQFLENVALIQEEYTPQGKARFKEDSEEKITLMTAHAAKGTEFSVVFMIGMEEGLFPHARSLTEKDEVEEERRLCYVAMTRAKDKLYISYTQKRFYFGESSMNQLSRFINDIPPHLLDVLKLKP